jgi:polar amino acid transport system substrate-binding protein
MSGDQAPLNVKSKSGEVIGLEADLAQLLAAAMGVELKIVEKPFPDLLPALKAGKVDMVMSGVTITLERNTRFAFVGPYFISGKSILTKSATLSQADESEDINEKGLTLTALAGSTSQGFVEAVAPSAKLVTIQSYDEGVKLVLEGKADALVADFPACLIAVLRHANSGLATLTVPLTVEPVGIALPPGDPLLVNLVENYLGALEGVGLLERLREKWFADGSWLAKLP